MADVGIRIGSRVVTGPAVLALLLLVVGGIVALLVFVIHPRIGMVLSGVIWVLFTLYWAAAAQTAAPTVSSESRASRKVHTRLLNLGILLLFIPVPGLMRRVLPARAWLVPVGLTVQILAVSLAVWARRTLGRNWSGAITVAQDHQLVTAGPYRKIRHPIYTAVLGLTLGSAVVSGELHGALGLAVMLGAYLRKIPLEEQNLVTVFGAEYEGYRGRSWRLVPLVY